MTTGDYSTGVPGASSAELDSLTARIQALLFAAPTPVSESQLAAALEVPKRQVEQALQHLAARAGDRGLSLQHSQHGYVLTTTPEFAADVEKLLELESSSRLTKAALEVLAVVAYQQPVTRPFIDSIRGVNSDSALRTLARYGLIEEVGRTDAIGRPILYATTTDFLQYFGLDSLDSLPPVQFEPSDEWSDVSGESEVDEVER